MSTQNRPVSVAVIAWVYIAVGAIGLVYHSSGLWKKGGWSGALMVEMVETAALLSGIFLLRGRNWARWVALAWIAFQVARSVFETGRGLIIHAVFCAVIAWVLLRPAAGRWFGAGVASSESPR